MLKSTDTRAESQPAKKTHVLQKQDSSKYLRGSSVASDGQIAFVTGIGSTKAAVKRTIKGGDQNKQLFTKIKVTSVNSKGQDQNENRETSNHRVFKDKTQKDISKVVNSQTVAQMISLAEARGQSQGGVSNGSTAGSATGLSSYLYH